MKIRIDSDEGVLWICAPNGDRKLSFSSPEAFELISKLWLRCGFDNKYVYGFTWLGRPVLQLPEDLVRIQEVIYSAKPDWIIETGVAHGGGLVFYASICQAIGKGRAIGVDVELRPHNREALETHPLRDYFLLVEGDSAAPSTLAKIKDVIGEGEKVLVVLDSNHGEGHVLKELEAYAPLVSPDSYIVVADGIMAELASSPLAGSDWAQNNPVSAVKTFLSRHPEFLQEEPKFPFNEGKIASRVTYWPGGFLRKISQEVV